MRNAGHGVFAPGDVSPFCFLPLAAFLRLFFALTLSGPGGILGAWCLRFLVYLGVLDFNGVYKENSILPCPFLP